MNCNFVVSKYRNSTVLTFDFGVSTSVAEIMHEVSHKYVNS